MNGLIIVAVIGLIAGLILSVASIAFAVPVDERQEAVKDCLPGANCGACGFSGCEGYAKALVEDGAEIGLCTPGGTEVSEACAEILGKSAVAVDKKVAVVQCTGQIDHVATKLKYEGIDTCQAVSMMFAGDSRCAYGCLGYGDCQRSCPENAITVCQGLAIVNPKLCIGCGICTKACPKGIIALVPERFEHHVLCVNRDKGGDTRRTCTTGCIGCMKCQKTCETNAITVTDNNATIDYSKCTNCGKCAEVCPVKAIL